jgi:hypothetical protein
MEIPERGKDGMIMRVAAFHDSDFHRFRGIGFRGIAQGGVETQILFKVPSNFSMNGCQIILKGHANGDTLSFLVVDTDNVLGKGAGLVLDTFCENWNVAEDKQDQFPVILPYKANLIAGLYFILMYKSVGSQDVSVGCNLFRHIKEV